MFRPNRRFIVQRNETLHNFPLRSQTFHRPYHYLDRSPLSENGSESQLRNIPLVSEQHIQNMDRKFIEKKQ